MSTFESAPSAITEPVVDTRLADMAARFIIRPYGTAKLRGCNTLYMVDVLPLGPAEEAIQDEPPETAQDLGADFPSVVRTQGPVIPARIGDKSVISAENTGNFL